MQPNAAMFLFIAAVVVAVFAFLSIAAWTGAQSQERKARDRYALLKVLAEQPGENAQRVLEALREQEREERQRKETEEQRGYVIGGLATIASGIGISVMVATLAARPGAWTVGLIPLLVGVVLTGAGLARRRPTAGDDTRQN
jgi:Flp pilus assembly protein TadB